MKRITTKGKQAQTQTQQPTRKRAGYRKSSMTRSLSDKIHFFKRTSVQTLIQLYDTKQHYAYYTALSDLPNYTEFTNLFDQYKILGVKIKVQFNKTSSEVGTGITDVMPSMMSVIDYDDATSLTSENEYLEYSNVRIRRMDKVISRYFRPRMASAAYAGAFTSYANIKSIWIDNNSPSVQHYGIKMMLDGSVGGGTGLNLLGQVKVWRTVYFACRNTV